MLDLDTEFPLIPDLIHLNHAAVGPWPRRTAEAVAEFARENCFQGSLDYGRWLARYDALKVQIAELINAESPDEIALVKNTSEGLSFVAQGIPWEAGDEVVISDEEFPSNRIVWEALADRGVKLRQVALRQPGLTPEQALMEACGPRTRLLSISAVQYASGLRMDLPTLGEFTRAHEILFCVDAIQMIGAAPFDVQAIGCDFAIADGHKWMLGPEGLGLFYIREPLITTLRLTQFGWNMVEDAGNYQVKTWAPARSARRFEAGSPNILGAVALSASLSLLAEFGMPAVSQKIINNVNYLSENINSFAGLKVISERSPRRFLGIMVVHSESGDNAALFEHLKAHHVLCAQRGGGIRLSPHFYTSKATLERALEILSAWRG